MIVVNRSKSSAAEEQPHPNMALRIMDLDEWNLYLQSIGIPESYATQYAAAFNSQQMPKSLLKHLSDQELSESYGVKLGGHRMMIRHSDDIQEQAAGSSKSSARHKAPQLRPTMSPSAFRAFVSHWQVYKKLVGLSPSTTDMAAEIFSLTCNDHQEIRQTIADYQPDHLLLSEKDYIEMLRRLLTARATSDAYRSKFFSMSQNPNESCHEWLKRLQEVVPDCDFNLKCNYNEGVIHRFDDTLLKTKFILGSYNEHIKQDLLTKSAEFSNLSQAFNHASRMEATSLTFGTKQVAEITLSDSSEDEEVCKLSTYRKNKRGQTPRNLHKQHTTIKHIQCRGCGSVRHGSERSSKCPAWNKTCHKCGKKGHFSKVCKSESPEVANALHIIAHVTQDASLNSNEIAVTLKSQLGQAVIEADIPMFADTGASICVAGITILRKLGVKLWQLKPTSKRIVTATNNEIKCRGWFPAKLSVGVALPQNQSMCAIISNALV